MKNIFIGFLMILTACTTASAITLTEKDTGQTTYVSLNEPVSIILKANATTGYTWHYSSKQPEAFTILKEDYITDNHAKGVVGVGGESIYQIKPIKDQEFSIHARYYRSWEIFNPDEDTELIFIFEIKK